MTAHQCRLDCISAGRRDMKPRWPDKAAARVTAVLVVLSACSACQAPQENMSEAERAAVAAGVEQAWADMMAGARALDPDRVRAGYVDRPIVAINGHIIKDFDRDQFAEVRRWFSSLRRFEADYDQVHLEVLSPSAAAATMYHHLRWRDTAGAVGEWNSAWTAVFQRLGGQWKIVYAHESVPLPTSN